MSSKQKISIGLWPLSGDFGSVGLADDRVRLIIRCLELGFSSFDTAPNYGAGLCEDLLGAAVKSTNVPNISITTKLGNHRSQIKSFILDDIKNTFDSTVKALGVMPKKALLHNPRQPLHEIESLVDSLREWLPFDVSLGISLGKDTSYPIDFINGLDCAQVDYNYLFKHDHEDLLASIQARSIFATGLLLKSNDTIINGFESDDHRSSWVQEERANKLASAVHRFSKLCADHEISPLEACLGLPMLDERVKLIILGIKNEKQLAELDHFLCNNLLPKDVNFSAWRSELCINSGY